MSTQSQPQQSQSQSQSQPQPQPAKPPEPIQEAALDAMISLVEGLMNTLGEKLLSSTLVLAPLSLAMTLSMRAYAKLLGRAANKDGAK